MADWPPVKNGAFTVVFPIYDADGDVVTAAASLGSEVSGDGATFADCTNEAAETATGSGVYELVLTAGEMNFDRVAVIIKTGTAGAKTAVNVMYTVTRQLKDLAFPVVSGRGIDVEATGEVGLNYDNTVGTIDAAQIGADAITAAKIADNAIAAEHLATDAIGADALATDAAEEISDTVWDEPLSGHTTLATVGQVMNAMGARTGEVNDAGPLVGDFDVDGFTEATNDHFNGMVMIFTSGVLLGQGRIISDYVGATKTITLVVDPGVFTIAVGDKVAIIATTSNIAKLLRADKVIDTAGTPWVVDYFVEGTR